MKYDYSKLRGRIIEKYGTQSAFAKELNITEATMSRRLNGSNLGRDEIVEMSDKLDIEYASIGSYFFVPLVDKMKH